MKKMTKSIVLAIVMLAFTISTFAQVSATATATATVLTPLTIAVGTNMNFGTFAASSGGDVILATDNTRTASGAGVTLLGGTITAAVFNITGNPSSSISVGLPALPITLTGSVSGTMDITALTNTPALTAGNYTIPVGGSFALTLGGTLAVGAAQAAGVYTNTTDLTVTINYN